MEKSSFTKFVEKYRDSKLRRSKLLELWSKIDKNDFDNNSQETFDWFLKYQASRVKRAL